MVANEGALLIGAAIAGLGVVCLPESACRDAIADGRLRRVLPQWDAGSVTTTLVMPHRRGQLPAVRATVDFGHIKRHYYMSHTGINPTAIVPAGPAIDFEAPHSRDRLAAETHA